MQEKNKSRHYSPRPGDGTQPAKRPSDDANWYGPSEVPQEEFIENSPVPEDPLRPKAKLSEGRPTFSGVSDPRDQGSDYGTLDARGEVIGASAPQAKRGKK